MRTGTGTAASPVEEHEAVVALLFEDIIPDHLANLDGKTREEMESVELHPPRMVLWIGLR